MIITKVENNRIVKYLPEGEITEELLEKFPQAFFYDGEYSPSLWVQGQEVSIVAISEPVKSNNQLLAETDAWMSRISEDTVVALITDGVVSKEQYAPIVIDRINYRRQLRGQPPI